MQYCIIDNKDLYKNTRNNNNLNKKLSHFLKQPVAQKQHILKLIVGLKIGNYEKSYQS